MNHLKYKCYIAFILGLIFTGAFSLLWTRQEIYLKASRAKILENELAALTHLNRRADLCIARLQHKLLAMHPPIHSKQIIWAALQKPFRPTSLAMNNHH